MGRASNVERARKVLDVENFGHSGWVAGSIRTASETGKMVMPLEEECADRGLSY